MGFVRGSSGQASGVCFKGSETRVEAFGKKGAGLLGPLLFHYKVLHLQAPSPARAPATASAVSAPGTSAANGQLPCDPGAQRGS